MNKIIFIILLSIIGYLGFCNYLNTKKIDKLQTNITLITDENSALWEKLKEKFTISHGKIIQQTKVQDKIITKIVYLPPESSATITTNTDGQSSLTIQNKGFTFKPSASFISTSELLGGLSCRFLFWDRYGLGAGLNSKIRPYVYADRRISDFIPFAENTAIGVCYDGSVGLIISLFF